MTWTKKDVDILVWDGMGYKFIYTLAGELLYTIEDETIGIPVGTTYENWTEKDKTPLDWTEKG